MRFPIKTVMKYVALALIALVVFSMAVTEVRYFVGYKLAPEATRNAAFDKYTASTGATVYHLGTIHGQHLETPGFGLGHLQAVIENLRPTLLVVEVQPGEMERKNPASGPVEMPIATLLAEQVGIPVAGIDWWTPAGLALGRRTNDDRDDKMFENLLSVLPQSGQVLVLTGFSHLLEFRTRYEKNGFKRQPFSHEEKEAVFANAPSPFRYPKGTDAVFLRAIEWAAQQTANTTDEASKERFERKRLGLQAFRARLTASSTGP